jgi:hypothetical protein
MSLFLTVPAFNNYSLTFLFQSSIVFDNICRFELEHKGEIAQPGLILQLPNFQLLDSLLILASL